jgi:hypothetical protein
MRTLAFHRLVFGAAITALVLLVGACDTAPDEPENPAVDQPEAQRLAEVVTGDVSSLPEAARFDLMLDPPMFAPHVEGVGWECVTRSPDPVAHSDDDRVPDSVRLTYTDCTRSRPPLTIEVNGVVDVLDLNPTVADHAIKWVLTDLTRDVTRQPSGETTRTVENGTRIISATPSVLQHQVIDYTSDVTFPNGGTASHEKDWNTTFTADVAGSISARDRLPSGDWEIDGTSSWSHDERGALLDVHSEQQLHYNSECTVAPRFDSGVLVILVIRGERTSTVTIEYTACGQYTVTRS